MSDHKHVIWVYQRNLGDGSCSPYFFSTKEEAEKAASLDDERYNDDINRAVLSFDEEGKLILSASAHVILNRKTQYGY